jgi:hypothetical protein
MTDPTPATVAVPVELVKHAARVLRANEFEQEALDMIALLPKPKPKLVAIDLKNLGSIGDGEAVGWDAYRLLSNQPDLLTLLDEAIDAVPYLGVAGIGADIKVRIRAALGVTE